MGNFSEFKFILHILKSSHHIHVLVFSLLSGTFWITEWALPFRNLAIASKRESFPKPGDDEVFFMQSGRYFINMFLYEFYKGRIKK